jgi:hypothetical protein
LSVPNQRIIFIKRISSDVRKDYFKIGHKQLNKVANDLSGNAFKLYIYLANNKDNYILELSSKDFIRWSGTSDSTYDRAFKELKEKQYLITAPDKKNIYLFTEESKTYEERHKEDKIVLRDEESINKLFGLI